MIELLAAAEFARTSALIAVAIWLSIAIGNNRKDRPTNIQLLGVMMRMELLKDEPVLGKNLKDRCIDNTKFPGKALTAIVHSQILIAGLLWIAAIFSALDWFHLTDPIYAKAAINVAVGSFFALWTFFLCGGLWFGYWIKTSHVQQVHFTLFIISLLLWQLAS